MSLIASQADFEQGGLYDPPYSRYPFFTERVDDLTGRFAPNGQKLLIVGCGYGYAVDDAVAAGYDAYGIDASQYAIDKGKTILPSIASRLFVADALDTTSLDNVAKSVGLHGKVPTWALLVTEDTLPCMSDAEISTALTNLRARCAANLLHWVTPGVADADHDARLNWKTIDEWRAVLCPPDVVGDCETRLYWDANGQV